MIWTLALRIRASAKCNGALPSCLQVTFEDVIAEPPSVRSFDKVWLWSHALFEVSRVWFYRLISLLLAVPLALIAGVLFALLSCIHIWYVVSAAGNGPLARQLARPGMR